MKKKYIQLGAAALVLAALIGALIFLQNMPETPAEAKPLPAEDKIYVLGGPGAPTPERAEVSVNVTDENGNVTGTDNITFVKTADDKFTVQGWEALPLDETALTNLRNGTMSMEAKRVVAENPTSDELAVYGLDKPRSSLLVNGETVLFGADAPGGEGAYAMKQATVYLVAPFTAEPFLKPANSLISLNVTAAPDAEFQGVLGLTLSGASFPEPIVVRRVEKPETPEGQDSPVAAMALASHEIVSPIQADVTTSDVAQGLTSGYGLVAQGVAAVTADAETLKAYGLDSPAAVMDVTGDKPEQTFTLSASAPLPDGTVYVQKKGQPIIYKFSKDQLPWMNLTAFGLMDKFANMANINEVKKLTVTVSDMVYEFNLEGDGDAMVVTYGFTGDSLEDNVLDLKNFRQFYQTVISARFSEELTTQEASLASSAMPLLQFFFEYDDGRPQDVVRFLPSSVPLRCVIQANDGPAYLCEERYVQIVSEDVRKTMLGEEVKAYF